MKQFELNKEYTYKNIEEISKEMLYNIKEYGQEFIGQHFILLFDENNNNINSFILIGATASNYIYKCIYIN